MRAVPVLWVSGAPGVGKSTAAWALYLRMRSAGQQAAHVDIDQLGLFAPAPPTDPELHRVKATILVEVLATFARHGAQQLIVSGIADPHRGIDPYVRHIEQLDFTLVRLRCDRDELRRRYLGRGSSDERLDELMSVAEVLDRNNVGIALDTAAMSPDEVADALADHIGRPSDMPLCHERPIDGKSGSGAPVLLVVGPTAVGKSTAGWKVLSTLWERGVAAAYVDVDQLGFFAPEPSARLKAENLARVWQGYRDAGARALIVVARGAPDAYEQALAGEKVTTVHLDASPADLAERVARRARGEGPRLAGDSLIALPSWQQSQIAARAADEAHTLRPRLTNSSVVVDTSGEDSSTVAARLVTLLEPALLNM
ncbi:AAA family ATPase [Amycolatopsis taiwanensis]|uniref:AAA family ATPase n=1 Tax=Amycolatopsis taiwanensis TaxID=342230 RepID=UPI0004B57AE0|nr:AAA family ATPase [Amycolatopsis taiwanensis]